MSAIRHSSSSDSSSPVFAALRAEHSGRRCRYQLQLRLVRLVIAVSLGWLVSDVARVSAQQQQPAQGGPVPTAVLLGTSGGSKSTRALDSVILNALEETQAVYVTSRPGLDLGAALLALDCVSETEPCLRQLTAQNGTDVLVAPSVARASGETVLTIMRFDSRDGHIRRVLHRQPGSKLSSATLDLVPDMVRELFGLPRITEEPAAAGTTSTPATNETKPADAQAAPSQNAQASGVTAPTPGEREPGAAAATQEPGQPNEAAAALSTSLTEPPTEPSEVRRPNLLGPLLLGGGGVLALGAGIVFGVNKGSAQSDYDDLTSRSPLTESDIDNARDKESSGKTNGTLATMFMGIGGAAIVGAGIWALVEMTSHKRDRASAQTRIDPLIGPNQLGLTLTKHGVGL